jgi:predicted nucleic acid-binding protein
MAQTVIVDTGVLIALLSQRDQYHAWAVARALELPLPWSTCESVLSETYHRIGSSTAARRGLWEMIHRGALAFPFALPPSLGRMAELLEKYSDLPTSVADANLLLMAERMPGSRIWTTDRDFLVYRLSGKKSLSVLLPD